MELQDQYLNQLIQISDNMKQEKQDRIVVNKLIKVAILSLVFMTVELVGGYFAGSIAILADAFHLLSDVMAYVISLFAVLYSAKVAPEYLTFGYQKLQPLGALANVAIIWVVTVELCFQATSRIINKDVVHEPWIMLGTSFFGLFCNLIIMKILHSDPDSGHNCGIDHGSGHQAHKHDGNCNHAHGDVHASHTHKHDSGQGKSSDCRISDHDDGLSQDHKHSNCSHGHGHKHQQKHQHQHQQHEHKESKIEQSKPHDHVHSAGCSHNHVKQKNPKKITSMKRVVHEDDETNDNNSGDSMRDSCDKIKEKDDDGLTSGHQFSMVEQIGYSKAEHSLNRQIAINEPLIDDPESSDSGTEECDTHIAEQSKIFENINIQAAYIHIISDIILSIGVIISAIIIVIFTHTEDDRSKTWTAWELVDPFCTYFFSVMAIYSTIKITKDSVIILLDGCDKPMIVKHVKNQIKHLRSCKELLELKIWSANRGKYYGIVRAVSDKQDKFKRDVNKIMKKRNIDCFIDVSS